MENGKIDDSGDWKEWSRFVLIELGRLNKKQEDMTAILSENTSSLREHMSQTAAVKDLASAAHKRHDSTEESLKKYGDLLHKEIAPIKEDVQFANRLVKSSLALVGVPAAIFYILKIMGKI